MIWVQLSYSGVCVYGKPTVGFWMQSMAFIGTGCLSKLLNTA